MKNKGVLHTVGTWFLRNNAITWQGGGGGVGGLGGWGWGWGVGGWGVGGLVGKQLNTTIIAFTGATRLKSCVRTHCFYLFDICRVEFI